MFSRCRCVTNTDKTTTLDEAVGALRRNDSKWSAAENKSSDIAMHRMDPGQWREEEEIGRREFRPSSSRARREGGRRRTKGKAVREAYVIDFL